MDGAGGPEGAAAAQPRPGGHGPGFFAQDAACALRERAEWEAQLGKGAVLCSDEISDSDASSEWEGGGSGPDDEESERKSSVSSTATGRKGGATKDDKGVIETEPLEFGIARERFVEACSEQGRANGASRQETLPNRLQRVRGEVGALMAWAEGAKRDTASAAQPPGTRGPTASTSSPSADEVRALAGILRGAASDSGSGARVWLPPPSEPGGDLAPARRLLELGRLPGGQPQVAPGGAAAAGAATGGYRLTLGTTGTGAAGWRAAAEAEALRSLEDRMQRLRGVLDQRSTGAADGSTVSLAESARQLHKRLETLEQVGHDDLRGRLQASVQLLSADIGAAIAEAERARQLEAEEHEANLAIAVPSGEAPPEASEQHIEWLHAQVSGLDPVALRAAEVTRQLQDQELASSQLLQFARDLGNAEDRVRQAREVLMDVSNTAQKMSESVAQSRKQLLENIKVLTRKLPQRGALDLSGR